MLGPSKGEGNYMDKWVIKYNRDIFPWRTLIPLNIVEIHSPVDINKRETFDDLITRRWGTAMTLPEKN